jgi:hypothetical protein
MDNVRKESAMSTIEIGATRETAAESLPELAAGLAVVVLTILGLASVSPTFLVEIVLISAEI